MKSLKKMIGLTVISVSIFVSIFAIAPVATYASEGPALPAQGQEQQTNEETRAEKNQNFFTMAVLLFGIGEFAGLIGKGVSNIHSTKRQERQEAKKLEAQVSVLNKVDDKSEKSSSNSDVLTYEEYKQGRYQEVSSIVKLPRVSAK